MHDLPAWVRQLRVSEVWAEWLHLQGTSLCCNHASEKIEISKACSLPLAHPCRLACWLLQKRGYHIKLRLSRKNGNVLSKKAPCVVTFRDAAVDRFYHVNHEWIDVFAITTQNRNVVSL